MSLSLTLCALICEVGDILGLKLKNFIKKKKKRILSIILSAHKQNTSYVRLRKSGS